MTAADVEPGGTPLSAMRDSDPWTFDLSDRIALARSLLGHADEKCWRQQIDRALAALEGKSIDEIREAAG